jgi:hypothetical protein
MEIFFHWGVYAEKLLDKALQESFYFYWHSSVIGAYSADLLTKNSFLRQVTAFQDLSNSERGQGI